MAGSGQNLSLRTRLRIWRARLSTPALLARLDEHKAVSLVAAINGGIAIVIVMIVAWLSAAPLVFPALGPTIFILYSAPLSPAAAPRSVVLGHFVAIASGLVLWQAVSRVSGEAVTPSAGWAPLCSTSLALAITSLLLVRLRCPHPPACASSMIVALGGVPQWSDVVYMALAVLLVTSQAVAVNRFAGLPVPGWSVRRVRMNADTSERLH